MGHTQSSPTSRSDSRPPSLYVCMVMPAPCEPRCDACAGPAEKDPDEIVTGDVTPLKRLRIYSTQH